MSGVMYGGFHVPRPCLIGAIAGQFCAMIGSSMEKHWQEKV
jgi:hypothetical protein